MGSGSSTATSGPGIQNPKLKSHPCTENIWDGREMRGIYTIWDPWRPEWEKGMEENQGKTEFSGLKGKTKDRLNFPCSKGKAKVWEYFYGI